MRKRLRFQPRHARPLATGSWDTSSGGAPGHPPTEEEMMAQVQQEQDQMRNTAAAVGVSLTQNFTGPFRTARRLVDLPDLEFLSYRLPHHVHRLPGDLQGAVHEHVLGLKAKLSSLVAYTALQIEERGYSTVEQAIDKLPAKSAKRRAKLIVGAEKQLSVSAQTLRVTVELSRWLNERLLDEIQKSAPSDPATQRELMFTNAVLVYEVADFVVTQLERLSIEGSGQLQEIYAAVKQDLDRRRTDHQQRRAELKDLDPEYRAYYEQVCSEHEAAVTVIERTWTEYLDEKRGIEERVRTELRRLTPIVRMARNVAHDRVGVLEHITLAAMIGQTVHDIQAAALGVGDLRLAPLTPTRLHLLIGGGDMNNGSPHVISQTT